MKNNIKKRVIREAIYMINTDKTIREIAKVYKVSKSTVHYDLKDRLNNIQIRMKELFNIFSYLLNNKIVLNCSSDIRELFEIFEYELES